MFCFMWICLTCICHFSDGDSASSTRDPLLLGGQLNAAGDSNHDDDDEEPPAVVVYLVDPFTIGSDSTDLQRLACLSLLRCFTTVLAAVPDTIRNNINVQVCYVLVMLGNLCTVESQLSDLSCTEGQSGYVEDLWKV